MLSEALYAWFANDKGAAVYSQVIQVLNANTGKQMPGAI